MNIFDLLKKDHDEIKGILAKIDRDLHGGANGVVLFAPLRSAVLAHAKAEEEVFYSVLEDHDHTEELAEQSEDEHGEIEDLLTQMNEGLVGDAPWRVMFEHMAQTLRAHFKHEESDMFRAARTVLGETDLEAMGEAFVTRKARVLSGEREALLRGTA